MYFSLACSVIAASVVCMLFVCFVLFCFFKPNFALMYTLDTGTKIFRTNFVGIFRKLKMIRDL